MALRCSSLVILSVLAGPAVACSSTVVREYGRADGTGNGTSLGGTASSSPSGGSSGNSANSASGGTSSSATTSGTEATASGGTSGQATLFSTDTNTTPVTAGGTGSTTLQGGSGGIGTTVSTGSSTAAVSGTGGLTSIGGTSGSGGTTSTGGTTASGGTTSSTGGTHPTGGTTSSTGGTSAVGGCDLNKPFGTASQIVPNTNSSSEHSISVAPDGLSAIVAVRVNVSDASSSYDLKRYTRQSTNNQFTSPADLRGAANINTASNEYQPRLTRDGLKLFFTRATSTSSQLFQSTRVREADDLAAGTVLPAPMNLSQESSGGAFISTEYFYWVAAMAGVAGTQGVHRTDVTNGALGTTGLELGYVNVIGNVNTVALTEDQVTMYLSSKGEKRTASSTIEQVWKATLGAAVGTAAPRWSEPSAVTELADSTANTYVQDVSPDGCILYLSKTTNSTTHRLYQVTKPH